MNLNSEFVSGPNTLQIQVASSGGSNGVYVNIPPPVAPPPAANPPYPDEAFDPVSGAYARPEPVDGASGRYFDAFVDLRLGGPLFLGFLRYYYSQFSATGFTTSLA